MTPRHRFITVWLATLAAAAATSTAFGAVRPVDRAGPLGARAQISAATTDRPDAFTRAVARHTSAPTASIWALNAGGFHWHDAGVGAAVGAAVCALLFFVAGRFIRPHRSATAY